MKIITIVRTKNESLNIERFIRNYQWVDRILVADGGSEDNTIELAINASTNVTARSFDAKIARGGQWRNPHGLMINFLIDWAEMYDPDWIIFDDCDCVPNFAIKRDWKFIFETADDHRADFILANRVYIYGTDRYFEGLTCPQNKSPIQYESKYIPSLWAWRAGKGFRAKMDDPFKHEFETSIKEWDRKDLLPPYCLLHYFYPTDEYMQKKIKFYNDIYEFGEDVKVLDPKEYGGSLLSLEDWMRE